MLNRVVAALDPIAATDPPAIATIRNNVKHVFILDDWRSDAAFVGASSSCILKRSSVATNDTAFLAMTIVHEAAHGSLQRSGVRYVGDNIPRSEEVCVEAEIAFAQLLPNSESLVAEARAYLRNEGWRKLRHPWR
jgi:hypothetical protein